MTRRVAVGRNERGAVAIAVAVMSLMLFGAAAIAVDLGNAWARGRSVQKQADVSAMSAGNLLPMSSAAGHTSADIAAAVADALNQNKAIGQPDALATDMTDGDFTDGEVVFQNGDGSACTDKCIQMDVYPPGAKVDFTVAGALGYSSTHVYKHAVVQIQSQVPPPSKIMPFWLPSGCGYGAAQPDTTQGSASASPTPSPTPTPTAVPTAPTFTPDPNESGNHVLTGTSPITVTQGTTKQITDYKVTNIPNNTDRATIRFVSPTNTTIDYAATPLAQKQGSLDVPPFTVGTEVTNTPGTWHVYALVESSNKATYSTGHLAFNVTALATPTPTPTPTDTPSDVPVGCVGQDRGNFGQLDSPRLTLNGNNERLAANIALGLDHQVLPFKWGVGQPVTKDCGTTQHGFIDNANPDTSSTSNPPRNCIQGDTGNDGKQIFTGLIAGVGSSPGRLDADAHGHTKSGCGSDVSVGGKSINNDKLSCYLTGSYTLADLAQDSGVGQQMLDPSIANSPRLVYLPLVVATDRAQKNFQPITTFVAAFITDETTTSTTSTNTVNGLTFNGNGTPNSVDVLHVFVFNKAALPDNVQDPSVTYDDVLADPIPRLVG